MGKVYSLILRPIRTFNIENRAAKVISKVKPTPAPQYAVVKKQKELVDKLYPDYLESQNNRNLGLDKRLKDVYVRSNDPKIKLEEENAVSSRPLPQQRGYVSELKYGFHVPELIPEGKCSLDSALTFMSKHTEDPIRYTAENIAQEYKLDKDVVENILKYFTIPKIISVPKTSTEIQPSAAT